MKILTLLFATILTLSVFAQNSESLCASKYAISNADVQLEPSDGKYWLEYVECDNYCPFCKQVHLIEYYPTTCPEDDEGIFPTPCRVNHFVSKCNARLKYFIALDPFDKATKSNKELGEYVEVSGTWYRNVNSPYHKAYIPLKEIGSSFVPGVNHGKNFGKMHENERIRNFKTWAYLDGKWQLVYDVANDPEYASYFRKHP